MSRVKIIGQGQRVTGAGRPRCLAMGKTTKPGTATP